MDQPIPKLLVALLAASAMTPAPLLAQNWVAGRPLCNFSHPPDGECSKKGNWKKLNNDLTYDIWDKTGKIKSNLKSAKAKAMDALSADDDAPAESSDDPDDY